MFKNGGWLNSTDGAFNQPSTYVGLQYVQRNPDLPPIDGLKDYLKEQERLRKEHEAYRKAAAPDDEKFGEIIKSAQGKALTGQLSEFTNKYNQFRTEFARKFQGDAVFSDEAKQYLMTMNSIFGQDRINEMVQNKTVWEDGKKKVNERKIGGEIWTDGDRVLVRDNETGEASVQAAHLVAKAMETPEGRKRLSLLTNDEAIGWKDKNWKLGVEDNVALGSQMSVVEINSMIDDVLTNIGHSSSASSREEAKNIQNYLTANGINVSGGNVMAQLSQKFKDNKAQLAEAQQRIYALLPQEAKAGIIANMLANGENPYGTTEIETPKGKQKVSNLGLRLDEIVSGAIGSRRISESEQNVGFSSLGSVLGEGNDGNAPTSFLQEMWNNPSSITGYKQIEFVEPKSGVKLFADYVPNRSPHVAEKFPWTQTINKPTNGKEIVFGNKVYQVGTMAAKGREKEFIELPGFEGIVFVDEQQFDQDGKPILDENKKPVFRRKGYMVRNALVPSSTLQAFNEESKNAPKIEIGLFSDRGINGFEADVKDVGARNAMRAAGVPKEIADEFPLKNGDYSQIRYYEPINELDGLTDDKNVNDRNILQHSVAGMKLFDKQLESWKKNAGNVTTLLGPLIQRP